MTLPALCYKASRCNRQQKSPDFDGRTGFASRKREAALECPRACFGGLAMNASTPASTTRRKFIENSGKLAAVSALANVTLPPVHAAGSDLIQVALIGSGGRGGGAAGNALSVKRGPRTAVAIGGVFFARP